jgi:hypothetical protein
VTNPPAPDTKLLCQPTSRGAIDDEYQSATDRRTSGAADAVRFTICDEYETWLREERRLTEPSIYALMWEGQNFLAWQLGRCGADSLAALGVPDIDCYVDLRAPKPANSGTT